MDVVGSSAGYIAWNDERCCPRTSIAQLNENSMNGAPARDEEPVRLPGYKQFFLIVIESISCPVRVKKRSSNRVLSASISTAP